MLSTSAFLALRQAIAAARADRGHTEWFEMQTPASTERIQTLCLVDPIHDAVGALQQKGGVVHHDLKEEKKIASGETKTAE